jgi:hypothetical protein
MNCDISKRSTLLLLTLLWAHHLGAQVTSTAQTYTVQVSTAQAWTDSGLDLQSGDVLELSATVSSNQPATSGAPVCDPKGVTATGSQTALPLSGAPAGALIARLHAHGAAPVLVGSSREFHIAEPSHLTLGINFSSAAICQGTIVVTVHVRSEGSNSAGRNSTSTNSVSTTAGTTGGQSTDRGQQLKSQLATAAQVFMSGQFGIGNSQAGATNAATSDAASGADAAPAPLKISDIPLDGQLRKGIDGLPRRVNDQFNNQGDMVNFVIVGSQKDVQAALAAATWHVADTDNQKAVLNALEQTYDSKDYLAMPMSTLYLFGRKQDFGYEMAEPIAMVASRHHFRIWKAPFTWNGTEVWCGAGTHDIGFAKDKRNGSVTHKIDPSVDGERDNIGSSLQKSNQARTLTYYLPPDPVQDAKNATGDGYRSDGRLLVIFLQ